MNTLYITIIDNFSNRELAILVWIIPVLFLCILKSSIRSAFIKVIVTLIHPKVFIPFIALALYIYAICFIFHHYIVLDFSYIKSIVFWYLFNGLNLLVTTITNPQIKNPFIKILKANFIIWLAIEFIVSAFTFPFLGELLFIPFIYFLILMDIVASSNSKNEKIHKILENINIAIGYLFLILGIIKIIANITEYSSFSTLYIFLIPPFLSILSIPFIYIILVLTEYESTLTRLRYSKLWRAGYGKLLKFEVLKYSLFRHSRLNTISGIKIANLLNADSITDFRKFLRSDFHNSI